MRKISFILAFLLFSTIAFSQLDKNRIYAGLTIGQGLTTGGASLQTSPSVSYSLSKHSLLSTYGEFTRGREFKNIYFADRTGRVNSRAFGVGYTYYSYFKKSQKLGWYINASFSINRFEQFDIKSGGPTTIYRSVEKQLMIKPGLFFKPSPRVMVFAEFGGLRILGDQHMNDFGNIITVGIRIALGKKFYASKE